MTAARGVAGDFPSWRPWGVWVGWGLGVGLVKLLLCARCGWHAHAKLLRCATSGEPHDPHKAWVSKLIAVSFRTDKAEKDKDTTPPTHPHPSMPPPCMLARWRLACA